MNSIFALSIFGLIIGVCLIVYGKWQEVEKSKKQAQEIDARNAKNMAIQNANELREEKEKDIQSKIFEAESVNHLLEQALIKTRKDMELIKLRRELEACQNPKPGLPKPSDEEMSRRKSEAGINRARDKAVFELTKIATTRKEIRSRTEQFKNDEMQKATSDNEREDIEDFWDDIKSRAFENLSSK